MTHEQLADDNRFSTHRDIQEGSLHAILGTSAAMDDVRRRVRCVLDVRSTVLIDGPTGTGKELVARAIHLAGPRRAEPFVPVNCGAMTATLLESELFGHRRGAFTDALGDKKGLFQLAQGGMLFLDEIGEARGPGGPAGWLHAARYCVLNVP